MWTCVPDRFSNIYNYLAICGAHAVPCLGSFHPLTSEFACVGLRFLCDGVADCAATGMEDNSDETVLCKRQQDREAGVVDQCCQGKPLVWVLIR